MLNVSIVAGTSAVDTVARPSADCVAVAVTSGRHLRGVAATSFRARRGTAVAVALLMMSGATWTSRKCWSVYAAAPASLTFVTGVVGWSPAPRPNCNSSCGGFVAIFCAVPSCVYGCLGRVCYDIHGSRTSGCRRLGWRCAACSWARRRVSGTGPRMGGRALARPSIVCLG